MVARVMFGSHNLFLSVGLVILLVDICVVFGQSNGDFWWLNNKLVNSAKNAREAKAPSARVINVEHDDDIRPVTEILDDIPPPSATFRNFISTTKRPRTSTTTTTTISTTIVPRTRSKGRTFLFPDEVTTEAPRSVKFQDNNVLESTERLTRRPPAFVNRGRAINRTTTTTQIPRRRINRVRFQGRSKDETVDKETETKNDQTASASENNLENYKDLSRYLTFS